MAVLVQLALIGLVFNSILSVTDYQAKIMELRTPPNIQAQLLAYDAPGKEYYLSELGRAWQDADAAKNDTRNMLLLYLNELESNLLMSSYCKPKLEQVYYDSVQAFSGITSLLEKDCATLEEMGVSDPDYSGKAKPVYLDLKETVRVIQHAGSGERASGKAAETVRTRLAAAGASEENVFNTLVGYPDSLFKLLFSQHKKFLKALSDIESEYSQERGKANAVYKQLDYRVSEYEHNSLELVQWDSLPLAGGQAVSSSQVSMTRAYYTAKGWLKAHDAVLKQFSSLYSNGRKAEAIVGLERYNDNASALLSTLEGSLSRALEVEKELARAAEEKFSEADPESSLYGLARVKCSETSSRLGERINILKDCILLCEKTKLTPDEEKDLAEKLCESLESVGRDCGPSLPDASSPASKKLLEKRIADMQQELEEYKEVAANLSRQAWEKYYALEAAGADARFLDQIRFRLEKADSADPDAQIGQIILDYQQIILELDKLLMETGSAYRLILPEEVLECGKDNVVTASLLFSGPGTPAYSALVKAPENSVFPDGSAEKKVSSQARQLNITLVIRPECRVAETRQTHADNQHVYYEKRYEVNSPLPVTLPEGIVAVNSASVEYNKTSWVLSHASAEDNLFRVRLMNPGEDVRNLVLSYPLDRSVKSCDSCLQHDGMITFMVPVLKQGDALTLTAVLSSTSLQIGQAEQPPEHASSPEPPLAIGTKQDYQKFVQAQVLKPPAPEPGALQEETVNLPAGGREGMSRIINQTRVGTRLALKPGKGPSPQPSARQEPEQADANYAYYAFPAGFAALSFMMLKKRPRKKIVRRTL